VRFHPQVSTATQVAIQNEYYHVHPEVAKGRQAQPQSRVSHESVSEETGVPRLNAEYSKMLERACLEIAPISAAPAAAGSTCASAGSSCASAGSSGPLDDSVLAKVSSVRVHLPL